MKNKKNIFAKKAISIISSSVMAMTFVGSARPVEASFWGIHFESDRQAIRDTMREMVSKFFVSLAQYTDLFFVAMISQFSEEANDYMQQAVNCSSYDELMILKGKLQTLIDGASMKLSLAEVQRQEQVRLKHEQDEQDRLRKIEQKEKEERERKIQEQKEERERLEKEELKRIEEEKTRKEEEAKKIEDEHRRQIELEEIKLKTAMEIKAQELRAKKSALFDSLITIENDLLNVNSQDDVSTNFINTISGKVDLLRTRIENMEDVERVDAVQNDINNLNSELGEYINRQNAEKMRQEALNIGSVKRDLESMVNGLSSLLDKFKPNSNSDVEAIRTYLLQIEDTVKKITSSAEGESIKKTLSSLNDTIDKLIKTQKQTEERNKIMSDRFNMDAKINSIFQGKREFEEVVGGNFVAKKDLNSFYKALDDYNNGRIPFIPNIGMVLRGKPGTGKTLLVKAFLASKKEKIRTYYIARAEDVTKTYEMASNDYLNDHIVSLVVIDDIDALTNERVGSSSNEYVSNLIKALDAAKGYAIGTIIVTNRTNLDPAITRSNRIDLLTETSSSPTTEEVKQIIGVYTKGLNFDATGDEYESLTNQMVGLKFTGAEIERVMKIAVLSAMKRSDASGNPTEVTLLVSDMEVGMNDVRNSRQ
ncbi:MAG: SpoVK/Ycf46/Vps4 family protein [Candidatus Paraimprobicoccus trichonymphae]|uniref:SpoVK/Ycf46/Vps4 family protein n=1 Tax=Candidatus Paraimprobicoccus trichonymphae TaxID=3033793 RepID=A0AA48I099_9FIRM|nr:MAG: SpoVK/Ycf46/Vps4 family protein [Candidatus Paraimprobicoccus trichonymphae]